MRQRASVPTRRATGKSKDVLNNADQFMSAQDETERLTKPRDVSGGFAETTARSIAFWLNKKADH